MPVFLSIFFILMILYALLIEYYRRSWNQLPCFEENNLTPSTTISVIVSVRNEEKNIIRLLKSLEEQSYPKNLFQVVIIDDFSEDKTWSILTDYKSEVLNTLFARLADTIISKEKIQSYKKKAIETGIRLSKGTLIVTTDADCIFSPDWLLTMAQFYENTSAKFIAAPVKIVNDISLLSIFQTIDFLTLQGITGASVYKRLHSMCNGANLAYERAAFEEVKGFEGIDKIPSGDDMLLMHKIYKRYSNKVFYLKNIASVVSTAPVTTWKQFFQQRIRWASKADSYDDKRIFWVLLLVYLLNCCFVVLGIAAFFKSTWVFFFILLLFAKVLIEFPFVYSVATFFQQQKLMKYFPLLQPLHIIYTVIAGWLGKFGSFEWKGRRIKK
ncbi:MAG: glycosyltransferase [Chitinophagaceae bacterium]